jgi:hypothetical protein
MSDPKLPFEPAEYSRRVDLVRAAMEMRGIDLLLVHTPENLFYLSGYDTSGYFAYQFIALPLRGEPEILTRRGEAENARRSTVKKRGVFFDLDDVVARTVEIVRGFTGVQRIGIEKNSWFLTVEVLRAAVSRTQTGSPRRLLKAHRHDSAREVHARNRAHQRRRQDCDKSRGGRCRSDSRRNDGKFHRSRDFCCRDIRRFGLHRNASFDQIRRSLRNRPRAVGPPAVGAGRRRVHGIVRMHQSLFGSNNADLPAAAGRQGSPTGIGSRDRGAQWHHTGNPPRSRHGRFVQHCNLRDRQGRLHADTATNGVLARNRLSASMG